MYSQVDDEVEPSADGEAKAVGELKTKGSDDSSSDSSDSGSPSPKPKAKAKKPKASTKVASSMSKTQIDKLKETNKQLKEKNSMLADENKDIKTRMRGWRNKHADDPLTKEWNEISTLKWNPKVKKGGLGGASA